MAPFPRSSALLALTGALALVTGCQTSSQKVVQSPAENERPVQVASKPSPLTAEERYQNASKELKNPSAVFLAYARMQERQGMVAEARESYGFVLRDKPEHKDAMLGLARLDQLAGRNQEAEQRYQQVAQLHAGDATALEALGQFYASQERWNDAVPPLRRAVSLAPNVGDTRYNLGVALAHTGDLEEARANFQSVVGLAAAHYNLGHILLDEGRFDLAERELIAATRANPDLEEAQTLLGELRAQRNGDYRLVGNESREPTRVTNASATDSDVARSPAPRSTERASSKPTKSGASTRRESTYLRQPVLDGDSAGSTPNGSFDKLPSWSPGTGPKTDELSDAQREQLRNQAGF